MGLILSVIIFFSAFSCYLYTRSSFIPAGIYTGLSAAAAFLLSENISAMVALSIVIIYLVSLAYFGLLEYFHDSGWFLPLAVVGGAFLILFI